MKNNVIELIDKLYAEHSLERDEYIELITRYTPSDAEYLAQLARRTKEKYYGNGVFIRGLIEISNICRNDCYYCGIRKSNSKCDRYRLTEAEILECCAEGYQLGFRTFVMQGGEDGYYTDERMVSIVGKIKTLYPDCAVTLSLGERSCESYKLLREAGADRYLLRHETSDPEHYGKLHPAALTWENRMNCLVWLRELGYQVGCGFMVGSPYQTTEMLARELEFIESFKPDMCGIGPFIPHKDTPFRDFSAGNTDLTCFLLSCIRLIHPTVLLPATTALGSLTENGREKGILSGANVVMPNLSPASIRKKYMLYDNKLSDGPESAQAKASLEARLEAIGCTVVTGRGDVVKITE